MASGLGRASMSENILKQGYLKRSVQTTDLIPSASKQLAKSIKQKLEPSRWYVFGVRNRIPYLEYFDKEESVFTGPPIHSYDLSSVQNISYTMGRTNTNFTFCIFLADRAIDITAPSRAHMIDWCRCLERNLRNLGLRSKHQKDEHQYTSFPVRSNYKPTQTSLDIEDNPSNEMILEDQLVLDAQLDSDDEDKEPDYQDATDLRLDDDDDCNDNGNNHPTLPLRPPPRLPKRDHSNTVQDEVFASISTVRRDEMYRNFESFNQEEHLFDTESDSDSDKEDDNIEAKLSPLLKKQCAEENIYEEEEEDRCTSLPNMPDIPPESDTSEDSDFISTSFWLRNRRPEHLDENVAPEVPMRMDSIIPKPKHRECVSMNMDYLRPSGQRSVSPSLICLEKNVPALPKRKVDERTLVVIDNSAEGDSKENNKIVLLETDDWHAVKNSVSSDLEGKISVPNNCDKSQSDDVDGGLYETLSEKPRKPSKLSDLNGLTEDSVYEATWECSSAKRRDSDNDDACCGMEPEELIVTLPPQTNEKIIQHEHVKMRNDDNETQSQKHRSVLSKIFSRKSKDKILPESLVVTFPESCSREATGEAEEGNLYSDFPTPDQEHTHTVCTGNHLDSDILKLSLLENGPTETSSIELPKRDFNQHPVRTFESDETVRPNRSVSLKEHIQGFNQDAYEPVDLSKSVNLDYHNNWFPAPSPPAKAKHNRTADITPVLVDSPIAPPRRNRKSDKSVNRKSDSPESQRRNNGAGSPPIPKKRQSVLTVLSASAREPALPPRNLNSPDKEKPTVPPPPRRGVVGRAVSDASGGARPKTIHLASRQQSINQSSALTVMNLKQNQVDILRSEIESTGGLVKAISKVHFQSGLALVECFNKIWIVGWDVKKFPRLYDKFHIGDQLVSINDVQVTDLSFAHKLVKNIKADSMEITIRRLPNARVYAIQRSAEGENLGIKRVGGTADIVYIDPLGLAYRHGLVDKATTIDGNSVCNWTLTEVNMRPLNLFFKDSEIERRLLAVGRDISIAVQPSDFVKELKKQVKKLKGYKDYLIQ